MHACTAGAAIQTFEELELWDSLVTCYRLLQKKNLAEEVVRRRLKVRCHTIFFGLVRISGIHEMALCTHTRLAQRANLAMEVM